VSAGEQLEELNARFNEPGLAIAHGEINVGDEVFSIDPYGGDRVRKHKVEAKSDSGRIAVEFSTNWRGGVGRPRYTNAHYYRSYELAKNALVMRLVRLVEDNTDRLLEAQKRLAAARAL
jgi:hypothetical protein